MSAPNPADAGLAQALELHSARIAEGCNAATAHAEACAYLRRKTGWSAPAACGVLDGTLQNYQKETDS